MRTESPSPSMPMMAFAATVAAVAATDAISKAAAAAALSPEAPVTLAPFLSLRLGYNAGVSYGLFPANSTAAIVVLITVQGLIIAGLLVYAARSFLLLQRGALALIVGGAVGNLIDRAVDGVVTDFIDLHFKAWHWPTFNLADTGITLGAVLLLWSEAPSRGRHARPRL